MPNADPWTKKMRAAVTGAIHRCHSPFAPASYRSLGIAVCEPWRADRDAFVAYVSALPHARDPGRSLDRIDNSRGYEPGNLRWATPAEQAANRRPNPRTTERLQRAAIRQPIGAELQPGNVVVKHGLEHPERGPVVVTLLRCPCGVERWVSYHAAFKVKMCEACRRAKLASDRVCEKCGHRQRTDPT